MNSDVDEEEAECTDVVVDVEYRPSNVVGLNTLVLLGAVLHPQPLECDLTLTLVEEPTFCWSCWHEERRAKAGQNGDQALEEEDVAPGVDDHAGSSPWWNTGKTRTILAIVFVQVRGYLRSGEKTAERAGHRCCRDVDADTEQ